MRTAKLSSVFHAFAHFLRKELSRRHHIVRDGGSQVDFLNAAVTFVPPSEYFDELELPEDRDWAYRALTNLGFFLAAAHSAAKPEAHPVIAAAEEAAVKVGALIESWPRLTVRGYCQVNTAHGYPPVLFTGSHEEHAFIGRNTNGMFLLEEASTQVRTAALMGASHRATASSLLRAASSLGSLVPEFEALKAEVSVRFFNDELRGYLAPHPVQGKMQPGMDAGAPAGAKLLDLLYGTSLPDDYREVYIRSKRGSMTYRERKLIDRYADSIGMIPELVDQLPGLGSMPLEVARQTLDRNDALESCTALVAVWRAHVQWSQAHLDILAHYLQPEAASTSTSSGGIRRIGADVGTGGMESPFKILGDLHRARAENPAALKLQQIVEG